uniref:Uncharacterized protein n=1 Tax=Siphoviridae sp. ctQU013 TaxID=2826329 RepID=A0A8S5NNL1_9CAUD|nr:MAG TPA: hypothetical protein [Siphoviridae sp. ctQU013]
MEVPVSERRKKYDWRAGWLSCCARKKQRVGAG